MLRIVQRTQLPYKVLLLGDDLILIFAAHDLDEAFFPVLKRLQRLFEFFGVQALQYPQYQIGCGEWAVRCPIGNDDQNTLAAFLCMLSIEGTIVERLEVDAGKFLAFNA